MADDQEFKEADAAVAQAVKTFVGEIEQMFAKWEAVAPTYIIEAVLLELATDLSDLTSDMKTVVGEDTSRLLDALVEYRDSDG